MHALTTKKNKIVLADYNYRREIEIRLLLAHLSVEDVRILREILDGSLKTTVNHLSDALEIPKTELIPQLDRLSATNLFYRHGDTISVDKEMRKSLDAQIVKFDPDYELGMEFLQSLLSKVPAHAIPNWYALSRATDHLFTAIVEKHLLTPRLYQRYLDELVIDYPHAAQIGKEVMKAENYTLRAEDIMARYKMSHAEFEECMLHLEYNLVCCLGYRQSGERWEEIVVPFHEWKEYLIFVKETLPQPIETSNEIVRDFADDFGFLKGMTSEAQGNAKSDRLLSKMQLLNLVDLNQGNINLTDHYTHWVQLPLQEQAAALYRHVLVKPYHTTHFNDHDLRQVQKSLKRVTKLGWIYFDDFIKGITRPIGSQEPVTLKSKGKRWRYTRPVYTQEEIDFIRHSIFETFLEVGIVATGKHHGKLCFCVTPFGRLTLDD